MRTRGKSEDGGRPSDSGSPNKVDDLNCELVEQKYCPDANIPISTGNLDRKSRSRAGSLDCSISSDNSESKPSKKKKRGRDGVFESDEVPGDTGVQNEDFRLFESCFPKEFEPDFSTAVFELGLKHSSPKVLMSLMPLFTNLHSEHLKSHLQKYRIHHERSKDEFLAFYNEFMRDDFLAWENKKGWEINHVKMNMSNGTVLDQYASSSGDSKLSLQVPSLEITNAASCLLNSGADNLTGAGMATSPFNRANGAQPQSPTGSQRKTRSLAGYKNVVSQASQLYSEWRLLFEESQSDVSKISNSTFSSSDCVNGEYDPKFNKGNGMYMGKGKRQQGQGPGLAGQCQSITSKYHDDSMSWQSNNNSSSSSSMNNNNNNSDANGSSSSSGSTNNLASISTDTIHNSHSNNIGHHVGSGGGGGSQNSNFSVLNGDPNMNMIYFNNNNNNPHPLLPLHLNPYGGYSNNYSPASSYSSLSLSTQQQSLSHSHPNMNSSSVTGINGIDCLSNLSNNLNVLNNLANLSNLNSYHNPPADSFLTLPVKGTGVSHYLPPLPLLSNSRVSSQDGSDADSNSESSNASSATCSTNETLSVSMTINGSILNNGLGNPYFYAAHEVIHNC